MYLGIQNLIKVHNLLQVVQDYLFAISLPLLIYIVIPKTDTNILELKLAISNYLSLLPYYNGLIDRFIQYKPNTYQHNIRLAFSIAQSNIFQYYHHSHMAFTNCARLISFSKNLVIWSCDLSNIAIIYKSSLAILHIQSYNLCHRNNAIIFRLCLRLLIGQHYNFIFKNLQVYKNKSSNFLKYQQFDLQ